MRHGPARRNPPTTGSARWVPPRSAAMETRRRATRLNPPYKSVPLHCPLWHLLQELLQLAGEEFGHAGGAVAARVLARRDQVEAPVLHPLELALHDAGLGRVALVVGRVDGEEGGFYALQPGRRVVVARGVAGIWAVVGVGRERRGEALVDQLVGGLAGGRELLVGERAAIGRDREHHVGELGQTRLRGVVAVVVVRIAADGLDQEPP